eukprot:403347472
MMNTFLKHCAVSLLAINVLGQEPPFTINTNTRQIVDKYGRASIFHGVNVVYKLPPYLPIRNKFNADDSLTDKEIDDLVKWGFNLVRLGVMWEAVETSPGVYDQAYLDSVTDLVNKLGQKGVFTLIDAHQDVFARRMCGEGMPNFYVTPEVLQHDCPSGFMSWVLDEVGVFSDCKELSKYNFTYDKDNNPNIQDCQQRGFWNYYASPESASAFERLFYNSDGLQDKFIAYWDKVSKQFGQNKYVIGFDPLNEPQVSNPWKDPLNSVQEGYFDKNGLYPLYQKLYQKYNQNAPGKIMFFEPAPGSDTQAGLGGQNYPLGFPNAPGGSDSKNLASQSLNDHSYCCTLGNCINGEPPLSFLYRCKSYHEHRINQRSLDAERLQVPLIMSEFGACLGTLECAQEITSFAEVCDDHLASWAYWQFKKLQDFTTSAGTASEGLYDSDGILQDVKVKALARTYLQAAQGVIQTVTFYADTGRFVASWMVLAIKSTQNTIYKIKA